MCQAALEDGVLRVQGVVLARLLACICVAISLELAKRLGHGTASAAGASAARAADGSDRPLGINGNVGEREEHILLLASRAGRRVGQTSAKASHAAGDDTTEAIGHERGAEYALNLVLQDGSDLIPAQVGAGDRVVAREAVEAQHGFRAADEVVDAHGGRKVFADDVVPRRQVILVNLLGGRCRLGLLGRSAGHGAGLLHKGRTVSDGTAAADGRRNARHHHAGASAGDRGRADTGACAGHAGLHDEMRVLEGSGSR
mmetsp:Transcript_45059/g.134500  ORF Transcript_45059/g.134500 Transcript_45059/m.134500 type:complete len:257 (-) Transcript_45059:79-849(-)